MRFILIILYCFLNSFVNGQDNVVRVKNLSDCKNAFNIEGSGSVSFNFTGNNGQVNDIQGYPTINQGVETNSAWFVYTPKEDGRFTFTAKSDGDLIQAILFQNVTSNYCLDLQNSIASVERKILLPSSNEIKLSLLVNENTSYPLSVKKDKLVLILFQTKQNNLTKVDFQFKLESFAFNLDTIQPIKLVDHSSPKSTRKLLVKVRDAETGKALLSNLTITESKKGNGLYFGSDFVFDIENSTKLILKSDVVGYFFNETLVNLPAKDVAEVVIFMEPLGLGKSLKIEGIEFIPGKSDFMPSAEGKLDRLKDFLVVNRGVNIEIQGHVFIEEGEKTSNGNRLSEARAKKVYSYLVEHGIDKNRMIHKGYGGTVPIYAKPKTLDQEQANRRVEVKIF